MKNKWLITVVGLTMTLVAITGGGFALAGNGTAASDVGEPSGDQPTVTSVDEIDPNVCNTVHNINACTAEELQDLGVVTHGDPTYEEWLADYALSEDESGSTLVSAQDEGGGIEPGFEVEDIPEPLFVDGEPQYHQSLNDAIVEDCGLAGGTAYATSDGEVGCVVAHDVGDSGEELVSSSQPPTIEPQSAPATQ